MHSFYSPCRSQRAAPGWVREPSYCPLHCGFTAQKQHSSHLQPPWHAPPHHLRWVPPSSGLWSRSTRFLMKLLSPHPVSGLQQLSRIPVLHQRPGLCWISSEHGHRFLPSRRFFGWADVSWRGGGTQQLAICPLWDVTAQFGRIHHLWSPRAAWRNPHGGKLRVFFLFFHILIPFPSTWLKQYFYGWLSIICFWFDY